MKNMDDGGKADGEGQNGLVDWKRIVRGERDEIDRLRAHISMEKTSTAQGEWASQRTTRTRPEGSSERTRH